MFFETTKQDFLIFFSRNYNYFCHIPCIQFYFITVKIDLLDKIIMCFNQYFAKGRNIAEKGKPIKVIINEYRRMDSCNCHCTHTNRMEEKGRKMSFA